MKYNTLFFAEAKICQIVIFPLNLKLLGVGDFSPEWGEAKAIGS